MEELNKKLNSLYVNKNWNDAVSVVFELCHFLNIETEEDFSLISDNQKINANVGRFEKAFGFIDRPATYELYTKNQNIEIKTFWVNKVSKTNLSWIVGISPNFEDGKVYQSDKYKVGIDIVIPKECDRVIILVSNNLKVRSLELKQKLSRTDLEIFEKLAILKNKSLDTTEDKKVYHNILWDAFNFEPINRKFYKELVDRFSMLREHLLSKGFEDQDSVMFSTRLIGRLLFVWFLRKKNLINENVGYFDASLTHSQTEYYKNKLERLFFNTLNTEILERDFEDNKTPYLNGGLFEPTRTDFYKDQKLSFPDGYFSQFYEVLSHYNFTVDESSPEFEQVAVDPEMLGRIFESLLAEQRTETGDQARKAKGAFYTPREIVSYMCEESLKEYLKTKIEDDAFRDTRIQEIVSMSESAFRDQDHNKRRDWKPYQTAITQALDELTVLDPAVGSGAYPMGMLHLLVKVYTRVDSKYEKNLTKLKRDILSRSLYGSDIDSTAIEISRLRAWLSLVVDMEEGEQVAPLPNLEFHFVCANTLISLPKEAGIFDTPNLRENLSEIRKDYYNTNSKSKKETLRKRYEKLLAPNALSLFGGVDNELKTYHPFSHESKASFFDPDLMFGVDKFDIVIGNPPYVKNTKIESALKNLYKKSYTALYDQWDLYLAFFEIGLNLLNQNGIATFITPNQWLTAKYGTTLRPLLANKIISFVDFRLYSDFTNASVNTFVTFYKKNKTDEDVSFILFDSEGNSVNKKVVRSTFVSGVDNFGKFLSANNSLIQKVNSSADIKFGDIYKIGHSFSIPDFYKLSKLIHENIEPEENDLKLVSTGTLSLSGSDYGVKKFKYDGQEYIHPVIKKSEFISNFPLRKIQAGPKLIISSMGGLKIDIDNFGNFLGTRPTMWLSSNSDTGLKVAFALLNSRFIDWYYNQQFSVAGMSGFKIRYTNIKETPYPLISSVQQEKIVILVEKILLVKKQNKDADTSILEKEIDELVYGLYGLTDEEIKIVEGK